MGANLAGEVASDQFCETTIGCTDAVSFFILTREKSFYVVCFQEAGALYKLLIESRNFRVTVVSDAITVEMCGALKNIVAVGAGFVDGLKLGDNTKVADIKFRGKVILLNSCPQILKAAVIRIGLMEMVKYVREFGGDSPILATFFESCGVADLVRPKGFFNKCLYLEHLLSQYDQRSPLVTAGETAKLLRLSCCRRSPLLNWRRSF